ncbi:YHYH protein, partial [archaeon]|nr:YHYH protein [archaeon]
YGGEEYYSIPDLIVTDSSGSGSGAKLRPVISGGKITEVKVISGGLGYSNTSTSILVKSSGINALLHSKIRELTVNENIRFGNEILVESNNKLKYTVSGYYSDLRTSFDESSGNISGIIGWAYDGNPIYGPYGYSDPKNSNSTISRIVSGYVLDTTYIDRPSGFASGFFVEDYKFTGSGSTLDKNNGRFGKTQEFPNGVYAYFATIDASGLPQFPYFIGNEYKSETLSENTTLNQSFNFSNSGLLRNTFPYKVSDKNVGYDFISEIDDIVNQKITVESVTQGSVEKFDIKNSGSDYKVNDILDFNDVGTSGGGAYAVVSSVEGKDISSLETTITSYEESTFTWVDGETVKISILPNHTLSDNDYVVISGLSTNLAKLNGTHQIKVNSKSSVAISSISSVASIGGTEIYVS